MQVAGSVDVEKENATHPGSDEQSVLQSDRDSGLLKWKFSVLPWHAHRPVAGF